MNLTKRSLFVFAMTTLGIVACKQDTKESVGIIVENMDTNVRPNDDFFRYVNGNWIDKTEIPDDQTSWGGFNQLRKQTDADVLVILNKAIEERDFPKVKDGMNWARVV